MSGTSARWPSPAVKSGNDLLPEPEDRNGRHWMRVELGVILMKFAFEISVQLWSPL